MSEKLLSYEDAAALVTQRAAKLASRKLRTEQVALHKAAGRVLARALKADSDQPAFDRSTRDGYACRAAEMNAYSSLRVQGSSRAGDVPAGPLVEGAVWEIMTGAPVPAGADAVVMFEHVKAGKKGVRLLVPRLLTAGENIVPRGAQAKKGDELLPAGTALTWAQIALAASCGKAKLKVYARPRVAILTTGDEVVSVEARPAPGQIRNSNAPMLAAMVEQAGGEPWVLPTASDNQKALLRALRQARKADLVLVTGGVSAGHFDLVEPALKQLGARFPFTGVRIQPGKPTVFAELPRSKGKKHGETPCFGLPGNPVSSAVTFLLFAAPVLAALCGCAVTGPRFALARLGAGPQRTPKSALTRFLPGLCNFEMKEPTVGFVPWQGSGDLAALARSNCFVVLPPEGEPPQEGALVRILIP
jgi:molybdopterin molybdotransferase